MNAADFGYNIYREKTKNIHFPAEFIYGRVLEEQKERYVVATDKGVYEAEITGNMRYSAGSREDFPVVGDWVALILYDEGFALINKLLPRYSVIKRKAVGQHGEMQMLAANVDYALLIQASDQDFNINRLERYLTLCYSSNVEPLIVLTKIDLIAKQKVDKMAEKIKSRIENIPVVSVSNETMEGYELLNNYIEKEKTYCILGSSGVGKSSLLNNLSGRMVMKTGAISISTGKGKHVTSHRTLVVLENGAILIDNPGMREVGIASAADGLKTTFEKIDLLSQNCRFKNCSHISEAGCAVIEALEKGHLDINMYENYVKMERENAYFESSLEERKRKERIFGKILKDYNKKNIKHK